MSETDNKFKQRIVGALVLVALAIIFLPMLFSSKDEHPLPRVEVHTPPPPAIPPVPDVQVQPVRLPEPEPEQDAVYEPVVEAEPEFVLIETTPDTPPVQPAPEQPQPPVAEVQPVTPPPVDKPVVPPAQPAKPARTTTPPKPAETPARKPVAAPGIDRNNLPVSWSIQLASLGSLENAERLRDAYRAKHYTAYVRSADGMHKVLIGPLIREAEAVAMCKQLKSRDKQDCFVVRYQP